MAEDAAHTIPPEHVRLGVERERHFLADLGITGPEAERRAVAITAGKIRNSALLAERQAHDGQCHVCGGALDDRAPTIAVLSGGPRAHLFMHAGCHGAYRARRAALVEAIMRAAGYGAGTNGEAA